MPVASQNSDKGLCRVAVTLVSGPKSPMSSGGTRYREEAAFRMQMVLYAHSHLTLASLIPTPNLRAAPTEGGEWWPHAGLWHQAEASSSDPSEAWENPTRTCEALAQTWYGAKLSKEKEIRATKRHRWDPRPTQQSPIQKEAPLAGTGGARPGVPAALEYDKKAFPKGPLPTSHLSLPTPCLQPEVCSRSSVKIRIRRLF